MATTSSHRHAIDLLSDKDSPPLGNLVVVVGDDRFIKRMVLKRLLGERDSYTCYSGVECAWRDLHDELATVSLFGPRTRRVLVEEADSFISQNRAQLEKLVVHPIGSSHLVLDVDSFPGNTNLYKAVSANGQIIDCRPPEIARGKSKSLDTQRMKQWLERYAAEHHHVRLAPTAWTLLIDLIGWEFGLLDQELAKLALFATDQDPLGPDLVQQVVGGWRTQTTWEMIDAVADGNAANAMLQLDHLLQAGEAPIGLLGSIGWSLRRFALATRIFEHQERQGRRPTLAAALQQAGFHSWQAQAIARAESQVKQMTRQRSSRLLRMLLELDLSLKGSHSSPDRSRFALESLFLQLSREARPSRTKAVETTR